MFHLNKNSAFLLLSIVGLVFSTLLLSSCAKEKGCTDPKALNYNPEAKESSGDCQYPATPAPAAQSQVTLELHQHMGAGHLNTASTYTLLSGQRFRMSTVRYYLSNFVLIKDNNSEVVIPNSYLLVQPSISDYSLGEIEAGTYNKIRFSIGIDSSTNSGGTLPVDRPAGHPLGLQNPSMFWTWASGYIFMKLEGTSDTLGTSSLDNPFSWHLGTNSLYRTLEISIDPITLTPGNAGSIHLKADLKKIVDAIDFRTERTTHTMGNKNLADKIMNLAATMFEQH